MSERRRFGLKPFREMGDMRDWMGEMFEELGGERGMEQQRLFLDVVERDGEIVVTADVPGVSKEDIDLRCTEDSLSIRAEREREETEEEEGYVRRERAWGTYRRDMKLPTPVDCDGVEASFTNGVLEVTLPKKAGTEGKQIEIE